MSIRTGTLLVGLVVLGACNSAEDDASPMEGMTAAEHAQMQSGGSQGTMDSTGTAVREMVHLTADQERALGVTYATVERGPLTRTIRTVGEIGAPEPRIVDVTPKIDGFVEDLFVSYTGESVQRGEPLLTLYSPSLVAAQEELLTARRMLDRVDSSATEPWHHAEEMLAAARRRLEYWDVSDGQIISIEESGEVRKALTLVAPFGGIVLEKDVVAGQRVMAGQRLYRIADISDVWVEGDVFEQDLQFVRVGQQAHIEVAAYSGEHLMGRVSFVYPTIDEASRTNRIRVTVPNPGRRLKPGMFATIFLDATVGTDVLTVPLAAVIVTGERNVVFVRGAEGMLTPREVVLGARAGNRVQILDGLDEGQTVVASANFLVDAESRLASTGGSMPGMQHAGHGTVIEPDADRTQPPMGEDQHDSTPPPMEHRHD
jgi:Cu(I)/Ag(I) efflux system membrane fusion protein